MPKINLKKTLAAALALFVLHAAATTSDEKHLSVYSSVATYTLPVTDRMGREYIGLLEVLEPLGRISAGVDGQHWKMRFNNIDGEFVAGRSNARVRGHDFDLGASFLIENSRGMVPLSALGTILPRLLGSQVNFREPARRLFIGDVAIQVAAQLDSSTPPKLVLNFTAPVNPTISTEHGKLRMVFTREPLLPPGGPTLAFENAPISLASFAENNGVADLTVTASTPLMASFSNNGRTITVVAVSPGTTTTANLPAPGSPSNAKGPPAENENPSPAGTESPPVATARRILVIVDAAHGGTERGAALSEGLEEKNVTLGLARLLRHELERQGFSVLLLRTGDDALTLDQRAGSANAAHAALYISLHATSEGGGARVYTALLPVSGQDRGAFHAWNTAQAAALHLSQSSAAAVIRTMQKHELPAHEYTASLRPLNNIVTPAIAIELAPGPNGVSDLPSANYQQKAAAAIADGVASLRDPLGAQP